MAEDANSSVDKEAADTKPDDSDNEDDDEGSENNGEGKERGEERGEDEEHRGDDEGGALENNKNLDTEKESSEQATDETNNDDEATPSYDKASEYNAEPSENENGSKDQVSSLLYFYIYLNPCMSIFYRDIWEQYFWQVRTNNK